MKNINNLIKICILLFTVFLKVQTQIAYTQIPINDPAWIIQSSVCDDFDGTSLNTSKWIPLNNQWDSHSAAMDFISNIVISGSTIKLLADTLIPAIYYPNFLGIDSFRYQAASIRTTWYDKYGYFEISAKYPTGNIAYWPGFWLFNGDCTNHWYNEIDIAENGGSESLDGHSMGTNIWISHTDTCGQDGNAFGNPYTVEGLPKLDEAFHKYAVQWNPEYIFWYFDDNLVRTFNDNDGDSIPQHPMKVVLDFYINPWTPNLPHMPAAEVELEYFNYYKLNTDCNTDLTICMPSVDYSSRAVEKSITTGGICSPTFNTSDEYTLRATDYVILDAGTTINPDGTGQFSIQIMQCPQ